MVDSLVVLAGGFGTRLHAVVSDVPKPLAPVDGRPFLYYLISDWKRQGVTDYVFCLHHKAKLIEAFLSELGREEEFENCRFRCVTEAEPRGTGGAVTEAVRTLDLKGSILIANADTWTGESIDALSADAPPAMALVEVDDVGRYGAVTLSEGKVSGFVEKGAAAGAGWINAGLYRLESEMFASLPASAFSLEKAVFPNLVAAGRLNPVKLRSDFIDIGVPDDYHRFCRWIENGKKGRL